jgi:glycine/D-amino acid oxidase-like deaminating enzyme
MAAQSPRHPALADASPTSYWLDRPDRPKAEHPLESDEQTELVVVGAGFAGLWTALLAREADPQRDVVLIEAGAVADGASGRNMGALDDSLTDGAANGQKHLPHEFAILEELGRENCDALLATLDRSGIDAAFEPTGILFVLRDPDAADRIKQGWERSGQSGGYLDRDAIRAEIHSDSFWGSLTLTTGRGVLDPARLAWGLRDAAVRLGVRIYEGTPMTGLSVQGAGVEIQTPRGRIRAQRAVLATNGFRSPVRGLRRSVVPMWGFVLMTEPLASDQLESIGWAGRQGLGVSDEEGGSDYKYLRLTKDNRILVGGYHAYRFASGTRAEQGERPELHDGLARIFFRIFPQLEGLRFTHRWSGIMGFTTTGLVSFGTTLEGRAAWACGYTGSGLGRTRFGARAALALVGMGEPDLLELDLVRTLPRSWPPEPVRWLGIHATQLAMDSAARRGGRPGPWLRVLERLGIGVQQFG